MDADTVKKIQVRRIILDTLNIMYPSALSMRILLHAVIPYDPHYSWQLLEKDATYLKEKKYIDFIDELIGGSNSFQGKVAKLTAGGKDIADRIKIDPTLEI